MVKKVEHSCGNFFIAKNGCAFENEEDALSCNRLSDFEEFLKKPDITSCFEKSENQRIRDQLILWMLMIKDEILRRGIKNFNEYDLDNEKIFSRNLRNSFFYQKEIWMKFLTEADEERAMNCYKDIEDEELRDKIRHRISDISAQIRGAYHHHEINIIIGLNIIGRISSGRVQKHLESIKVTKSLQREWCAKLRKYPDSDYADGMELEVTEIYSMRHGA